MLNQTFSKNELAKVLKKGDGRKYNLWTDPDNKDEDLKKYAESICEKDYGISHILKQYRKQKPVFVIDPLRGGVDYLAIRKVDRNLRSIYKVKQADRASIVRQLLTILTDGSPMYLLKLDIKSFYESIDPSSLLDKIKVDQLVSKKTEMILQSLFVHPLINSLSGLPRGLPVSATFSELYMRSIDRKIRNSPGVYFYSRFVDDIVIIGFDKKDVMLGNVKGILQDSHLFLNPKKQEDDIQLNGRRVSTFSYLGYKFSIQRKNNENILYNFISVSIADSKLTKIKKRIIKAFLDYFRNTDFPLLKNRLKFLTGNCAIDITPNGNLMVGNYYNYPELTDVSVLRELDRFLFSLLFWENGYVGRKIISVLTKRQILKLAKYSFVKGYDTGNGEPMIFYFSQRQINNLTRCWKYE
ncbi:MAG: RNA-directed DNA polymerase [Desulfatibacillum sp.]|nr:RNA-directed DNA polymerase [Desulfatibacillum sp.]